mmetsp:Transcript_4871/g.12495  ORF Transcript_4871/g.12495 Transcript_4871/m.12495 type:complete len:234 (-) Transcript_4871:250-951(-)
MATCGSRLCREASQLFMRTGRGAQCVPTTRTTSATQPRWCASNLVTEERQRQRGGRSYPRALLYRGSAIALRLTFRFYSARGTALSAVKACSVSYAPSRFRERPLPCTLTHLRRCACAALPSSRAVRSLSRRRAPRKASPCSPQLARPTRTGAAATTCTAVTARVPPRSQKSQKWSARPKRQKSRTTITAGATSSTPSRPRPWSPPFTSCRSTSWPPQRCCPPSRRWSCSRAA